MNIFFWEAVLYCKWLTEQLRKDEYTPEPLATLLRQGIDGKQRWCVTLPSEAQWEKAARGKENYLYPWGNEFDILVANDRDPLGSGYNACVGCFSNHKSPYGCEDLNGIWNWTRTVYKIDRNVAPFNYPYDPTDGREDWHNWPNFWMKPYFILRGSSFSWRDEENLKIYTRCSSRGPDLPDKLFNDVGFRLVICPDNNQPNLDSILQRYIEVIDDSKER